MLLNPFRKYAPAPAPVGGGATAYRYYRIYMAPRSADIRLYRMELRTVADDAGSDVLAGASSITWSGIINDGTFPDDLIDGSDSTWIGFDDGGSNLRYLDIDLGSAQAIAQFYFKVRTITTNRGPYGYALLGSDDGSTFVPLFGAVNMGALTSWANLDEYTAEPPDYSAGAKTFGAMLQHPQATQYQRVTEFEFRQTASGSDECTGGAAADNDGGDPANVFDDDTTTSWREITSYDLKVISYAWSTAKDIVEVYHSAHDTAAAEEEHELYFFRYDGEVTDWSAAGSGVGGALLEFVHSTAGSAAMSNGEDRTYSMAT